jgi:hypothetical protein
MVEVWAFNVLDNGQTQTPRQGYHEWFIGIDKGHVLHLTRCSIPIRKVSPRNIPTTQNGCKKCAYACPTKSTICVLLDLEIKSSLIGHNMPFIVGIQTQCKRR